MTDIAPPPPPPPDESTRVESDPYQSTIAYTPLKFSGLAIAGFVIGIVAFFVLPILGVLALALSVRGLRNIRRGIARGKGLAIAGIVLGGLDILWWLSRIVITALGH